MLVTDSPEFTFVLLHHYDPMQVSCAKQRGEGHKEQGSVMNDISS